MSLDEKILTCLLVVLVMFLPGYVCIAVAFFRIGDAQAGFVSLAWAGLIVLARRYGRCVLRDRKDDDNE